MERLTKKQISESFSEWFNYFKGLEKEKKVKYFLALLLIIAGATYYHFNINIGSTQINIQNNSGNNKINIQNNSGNNQITIQNATLINSPTIQSSPNTSVLYNVTNTETESGIPNTNFYTKEFYVHNYLNLKADVYFVKVVLPDRQIAFLDEFLLNTTYNIALCNGEGTDCYIYHRFRVNNLTEDQVCLILSFDNKVEVGKKFLIDPDKCFSGDLTPEGVSRIYITLAGTAQQIGNNSLAYQYAKKALDASDTPFNNAAVASTLLFLGNYTDALNYGKKALQAEPNNSWIIGLNNEILKANAMQK